VDAVKTNPAMFQPAASDIATNRRCERRAPLRAPRYGKVLDALEDMDSLEKKLGGLDGVEAVRRAKMREDAL